MSNACSHLLSEGGSYQVLIDKIKSIRFVLKIGVVEVLFSPLRQILSKRQLSLMKANTCLKF
jgi:hypothetical protein